MSFCYWLSSIIPMDHPFLAAFRYRHFCQFQIGSTMADTRTIQFDDSGFHRLFSTAIFCRSDVSGLSSDDAPSITTPSSIVVFHICWNPCLGSMSSQGKVSILARTATKARVLFGTEDAHDIQGSHTKEQALHCSILAWGPVSIFSIIRRTICCMLLRPFPLPVSLAPNT